MNEVDPGASATALRKLTSLFAMPLFEVNGMILSGDQAQRHDASWEPDDPIGVEAFVNHYHLEDYVEGLGLDPRRRRRELNRLADAVARVWAERLAGILGERTALFYLGGGDSVIVRFHLERPGSVPWTDHDPAYLKKQRLRVFRASRGGLERLC